MQSPAILLLALQLQSQAAEALRTATTLHLEITTERELHSENHRTWTRSHELIAKANNALHYEVNDTSGSHISISTATKIWSASPDTREFVQPTPNSKPDMALSRARLALNFQASRLTNNLKHAEQLRTETIEHAGNPVECLVVRADYTPTPGIDA